MDLENVEGAEGGDHESPTAIEASVTVSSSHDDDLRVLTLVPAERQLEAPTIMAVIDLCTSPSTSTFSSTNANAATASKVSSPSSSLNTKTLRHEAAAAEPAAATTLECPICLQTCIHPARLPCGHIFCFLCVKGVAYKNRRCAMCRREIPPEFLDHPQLVNGIDDICTTKTTEDGYQWFYEGRNGWWQYDDRTSQDIEDAYKKGEKSCTILVAGYVYIVDLEAMVQQRQNEPTRCRRVKRDLATIAKKGVAGLRIEGNTVTTDSNFASQVYQSRQQGSPSSSMDAFLDLTLPLDYSMRHYPANASDFVSTIAATDAAIRIASDIIGSTLAHADELSRSVATSSNASDATAQSSGENHSNFSGTILATSTPVTSPIMGASAVTRESHELLGAAEDLLDATQNVISEADQQTIDLFEQTLNDFHALTLRNIIDSSDDENDDGDTTGGSYTRRQLRF